MTKIPVTDALFEAALKKIKEEKPEPKNDDDSEESKDKKKSKAEKITINPELHPQTNNNPGGANNSADIAGTTRLQTV